MRQTNILIFSNKMLKIFFILLFLIMNTQKLLKKLIKTVYEQLFFV